MATPVIYTKLQNKLSSLRFILGLLVFILFLACAIIFTVFRQQWITVGEVELSQVKFMAVLWLSFVISLLLSSVAGYQQDPYIWRVPVVGRMHRALVSKSTPWGEAMRINLLAIAAIPVVAVFIYVAQKI